MSLRWDQALPLDLSLFALLTPSLHSLDVSLALRPGFPPDLTSAPANNALRALLCVLRSGAPDLQLLRLSCPFMEISLLSFIRELTGLKTLDIQYAMLNARQLLDLGISLPNLLHLRVLVADSTQVGSLVKPFISLESLDVAGALKDVTRLLLEMTASPLKTVRIHGVVSQRKVFSTLCTALDRQFSASLLHVDITCTLSDCTAETPPRFIKLIEPILHLQRLQKVALNTPGCMNVRDDDFLVMAQSWPALTHLDIHHDFAPPPPSIHSLAITVEPPPDVEPPLVLSHKLRELQFTGPPIEPAGNTVEVAEYLDHIFPNIEADLGHGGWEQVASMLPILKRVRRAEMARVLRAIG
ncbi:hypothetical protein B0H21DRAFT_825373 [Amylocystis lapponica]|nr:hypothetical protein B0H21DRAFT_825373 [Amylocystis lapponica]